MDTAARRFLFLLSSTRRMGNSEQLAYCAAHHLPEHATQQWLHLQDYPLPYFVDMRHHTPYPPPTGNAQLLLEATLAATDVVIVAPLYWYSLPVHAKHYLDYWSAWLRTPGLEFREQMRGKTLWSIVVSSGELAEAAPLEASLVLTANYMQMPWGGMLYGTGSRPNDIQDDAPALERAKSFFLQAESDLVKMPSPMPKMQISPQD
ncbi:flavodoxin family protein [Hymenobacter monticola]|uniref:NAD(P)H-dependent oxidoreductase n=1 Tax=Hymenobacter monticola TaxID=1705399 RepID=A0ABY4B1J4_9BACT|nr:NAD(P)H-dependent oxidoreductase [Hymenobacter monticola]UOE32997.1 NAD(P)H-dependent oxidoreductase [Hymenobacter monticola]